MNTQQFRDAVIQLYGRRSRKDYAELFGITAGAFGMFWQGHKKISKPMEQRLRTAFETRATSKRPTFLIYNDDWCKSPHKVLWPDSGIGRQLWLLLCREVLVSKAEFLLKFDRIALTHLPSRIKSNEFNAGPRQRAWDNAEKIWASLVGRRVMILDQDVSTIIGYPVITPEPYMRWREYKGVTFCRFPRRDKISLWQEHHFNSIGQKLREVYFGY